ncbi:DUF4258 domain-containing protein [Candidatus Woesearchaeota archaeon]|nr:DUF4258 domain-containing protein [Candidatus Woesearchaeota archaeon]
MNSTYTDYAEETLKDREISKENVELALLKPIILSEGKKGRKIAHKIFGTRLLRVVFETEANAYIVITAYYAKPERYIWK